MGQHHGVLGGVGVVGVNLRVAGVVVAGHVDGLLAQGVGNGSVHLAGLGQLNHLHHILESRLTAQGRGAQAKRLGVGAVAGDILRLDKAQIIDVDDAVLKARLADRVNGPHLHVDAGDLPGHPAAYSMELTSPTTSGRQRS